MKKFYPTSKMGTIILAALLAVFRVYPQSSGRGVDPASVAAGHLGAVSVMVFDPAKNNILSAGVDGFLGVWNIRSNSAVDHFQVSPYAIRSMILRPEKSQVAMIESDNVGIYRLSVWDYELKQNLFTLRFKDPVTFMNYSAGGNFLILARSAREGVVFIHPETGAILDSPSDIRGTIGFAATGKSERTMITYATSGIISYWELDSGNEIQSAQVPANLMSPLLFGNNRYFCGIDTNGLIVIDAISGKELDRDRNAARGKLFSVSADTLEFMYLGTINNSVTRGTINLTHYTITGQGKLSAQNRTASSSIPAISSGVTGLERTVAFGAVDGGLWLFGENDRDPRPMNRVKPVLITSTAVSGDSLVIITEDKYMGVLSLDYQSLRDRATLNLENSRGNTQISADPSIPAGSPGRFLLWQTENIRSYPLIIADAGTPERRDIILGRLTLRHPLRSASILGNQALFLDSTGNITLLSTETGVSKFTYTAMDPLDISFVDENSIIIGQTNLSQNAPFLVVYTNTEETVPFFYPSAVGARLYRAPGGSVYGGVVEGSSDNATTALLLLDHENPQNSIRLVEYQGEDTTFIIAESGDSIASTLGGNMPTLHSSSQGFIPFENLPSLPVNIIGTDKYFIVMGKDGSVSWHDPASGTLIARLRLYDTEWLLEAADHGRIYRGPIRKD